MPKPDDEKSAAEKSAAENTVAHRSDAESVDEQQPEQAMDAADTPTIDLIPEHTELVGEVYEQLRAIARQRMAGERADHTLQATALVHEAFYRISQNRRVPFQNPGHFYVAAAEAMRRVLLDHAKSKGRQKRGGDRKRVPINVVDLADCGDPEDILALDEAMCRLKESDPEAAAVVELRFLAGLSVDETAESLGISARTVDRRWKFARAWLFRELSK